MISKDAVLFRSIHPGQAHKTKSLNDLNQSFKLFSFLFQCHNNVISFFPTILSNMNNYPFHRISLYNKVYFSTIKNMPVETKAQNHLHEIIMFPNFATQI